MLNLDLHRPASTVADIESSAPPYASNRRHQQAQGTQRRPGAKRAHRRLPAEHCTTSMCFSDKGQGDAGQETAPAPARNPTGRRTAGATARLKESKFGSDNGGVRRQSSKQRPTDDGSGHSRREPGGGSSGRGYDSTYGGLYGGVNGGVYGGVYGGSHGGVTGGVYGGVYGTSTGGGYVGEGMGGGGHSYTGGGGGGGGGWND